jgi:hypothetical protein
MTHTQKRKKINCGNSITCEELDISCQRKAWCELLQKTKTHKGLCQQQWRRRRRMMII